MIFKNFCLDESIDPSPFRSFCLQAYLSGWQIINSRYALELAWKRFLAFQYMRMLAELESK
jgi:hypothetical protein